MTNFLKVVLLFLLVFDPQVPLMPNGVGFSFVVFFVLIIPFTLKFFNGPSGPIVKASAPLFVMFFLAFILIISRVLLSGGGNLVFSLSLLKAVCLFSAIFFYFFIFYKRGVADEFFYSFALVYFMNAIFNFAAGTYPEYFEVFKMFRSESISDSLGMNPYRDSFLAGSGYFSIGTGYGLAALLLAFYLVRNKAISIFAVLALALISVAGFVAARTSFFAIFFAFSYILFNRPVYAFYVLGIGVAVASLILVLPFFEPYINWLTSFFVDFESSESANYLLNEMYFWPDMETLLFGAGAVNDGRFIYTDAGYMQDILFGGVMFLLIKLFFVLVFFDCARRVSWVFAMLFCVSILIFHMKGLFLYNNAQGMAVYYIAYFYLYSLFYRHAQSNRRGAAQDVQTIYPAKGVGYTP